VLTFSRTFFFQIADVCGNLAYCDVAFVAPCGNFCTYTQGGYGNAGGTHSNGLNTTQTLDSLLLSGPIVIGGGTGDCGFAVATTDCVLGILPAGGPSVPLPADFALDCDEAMNNTLAGQLVTLELNIRYNAFFNDADYGAFGLSCVLPPSVMVGLGLGPDATVDDLAELGNQYLASICNGINYPPGFGGQINAAVTALNEAWHDCEIADPCTDPVEPGVDPGEEDPRDWVLYPNPTYDRINLRFSMDGETELQLRFFASEGKLIKTMKVQTVEGQNLVEIDLTEFATGVYWVNITGENIAETIGFAVIRP
jgi:hypothetical protein